LRLSFYETMINMETVPEPSRQQEIVQSIRVIDYKLQQAQSSQEFAALEKQLANALEDMLRQVTTKFE
jgi:hypothetical protein